jgi:hypothetical protein
VSQRARIPDALIDDRLRRPLRERTDRAGTDQKVTSSLTFLEIWLAILMWRYLMWRFTAANGPRELRRRISDFQNRWYPECAARRVAGI